MHYKVRWNCKKFYDGFERRVRPVPNTDLVRIVSKSKNSYHLTLYPEFDMYKRISINKNLFKILKVFE